MTKRRSPRSEILIGPGLADPLHYPVQDAPVMLGILQAGLHGYPIIEQLRLARVVLPRREFSGGRGLYRTLS